MPGGSLRALLVAGAGMALAACGGSGSPGRTAGSRPTTTSGHPTPATWAAGVTAAAAGAGTATAGSGISPWLAPPETPAPAASRAGGCAALHDRGWKAQCLRVDTGAAVLTGVVESRPGGQELPVWRATVWREQGQQELETLTAGDASTPLWAWAAVRSADLLGTGHRQLVFGFENEGTGGVLDMDVVTGDGGGLVAGQISVYKGAATLSGQRILTYHPVYREADPNCCPTGGADRDTVELRQGQWVVVASRPVALPGPSGPRFPDDFGPPRLR